MLDRFLAGVLLEDDGSTADDYALLLVWMFATGVPGVPRDGMQALPEQLAARLARPVRARHPRRGGRRAVRARRRDDVLRAGRGRRDRRRQATALTGVDGPGRPRAW